MKRRGTTQRRRRANPGVPIIVANAHRGAPRRRRKPRRKPARRKARRSASRAPVSIVRARTANPTRRRGRRRLFHAKATRRRHRRHSNPTGIRVGGFGLIIRMGAGAMLGIIIARVAGNAYTSYVSAYVRGDDSSVTWRQWLDDVLRLVAMELAVWGTAKALEKLRVGGPMERYALFAGGSGEVVRQAIGAVLHNVSPDTDRSPYGLDGSDIYVDEKTGAVYQLNSAGQYALSGALGDGDVFYTLEELGLAAA